VVQQRGFTSIERNITRAAFVYNWSSGTGGVAIDRVIAEQNNGIELKYGVYQTKINYNTLLSLPEIVTRGSRETRN